MKWVSLLHVSEFPEEGIACAFGPFDTEAEAEACPDGDSVVPLVAPRFPGAN